MLEIVVVICLSAIIIVQAVVGSRRSEAESQRIERAFKLGAAETPAERFAALSERNTAPREPRQQPHKPIGL